MEVAVETLTPFWLNAPKHGFSTRCNDEAERMRFTREAWLLSSGEVMSPRKWRDEQDFARQPKREAA